MGVNCCGFVLVPGGLESVSLCEHMATGHRHVCGVCTRGQGLALDLVLCWCIPRAEILFKVRETIQEYSLLLLSRFSRVQLCVTL